MSAARGPGLLARLREWARRLKGETLVLALVAGHPDTPWYAKVLILAVVAYALSPIDLIPDFIPVLGYLDDLILLPLGIALAIRLVPPDVMAECRAKAGRVAAAGRRAGLKAAFVVAAIWIATLWLVVRWTAGLADGT